MQGLKAVMNELVPKQQEEVKAFRKEHGGTKIGEITVDMVSLFRVRDSEN
jgi:citrate synthase